MDIRIAMFDHHMFDHQVVLWFDFPQVCSSSCLKTEIASRQLWTCGTVLRERDIRLNVLTSAGKLKTVLPRPFRASSQQVTESNMASWLMESKMLYKEVIENVMQNCKELFLDENIPEDILMDLKATWEHSVESCNMTNFSAAGNKGAGRLASTLAQLDRADSGDEEDILVTGGVEDDRTEDVNNGSHDTEINMSEEITSEDDEPEVEATEAVFETENILVCQYDKISRAKNKFKINLKLGIMTVNDKDYVFNKCTGEVEW